MSAVSSSPATGAALGALFAGWALLSHPGAPGSVHFATLIVGGTLAWFLGTALARLHHSLPGLTVTAAVAILFLLGFPDSLLESPTAPPLGYSNANAALATAAVAGVIGTARASTGGIRVALVAAAMVCALVSGLTGSRAGLVVSVLLLCTWPLVTVWSTRTWRTVSLTLTASTFGATVALALAFGDGRAPAILERSLSGVRTVLWSDALQMARESPVRGVGPGDFAHLSNTAQQDPDLAWAHSAPLQVLAELGGVGFVLMAVLVVWMIWRLRRWSIVLAILALQPMIDHVLDSIAVVLALGVVLGGFTDPRPARRRTSASAASARFRAAP